MKIDRSSPVRHPSALLVLAAIALSLTSSLAGCGKHEPSTQQTQTRYEGKPDTPPWDNSRWQDNREKWERAITARAQNQNEYVRIPQ